MFPKTRSYVKKCNGQTRWMYFLIDDIDLSERYNTIWDKVSTDIKKNLILSLSIIYIYIFLKTNVKSHGDEVTVFCDKGGFKSCLFCSDYLGFCSQKR